VTFDPHPKEILVPDRPPRLLTTLDEKTRILAATGIDLMVVLPFTAALARMDPEAFIWRILVRGLHACRVVVGCNFSFGRARSGHVGLLRDVGCRDDFAVDSVAPLRIGETVVSSTRIRRVLQDGNVGEARGLLGRPYSLEGVVVAGEGRGRTLGYRTANLELADRRKVIPRPGVYVVTGEIDGEAWRGMLNIGTRPTFARTGDHDPALEVHILDWEREVYGAQLRIYFWHRLREEVQFPSGAALSRQLRKDEQRVRELLCPEGRGGSRQKDTGTRR
jgi:riboflavin kinase/FMN adenylyltransferase